MKAAALVAARVGVRLNGGGLSVAVGNLSDRHPQLTGLSTKIPTKNHSLS